MAAVVNAGFVAVKVDREERPDVDAVYMAAVTALTGHGGWPMTCLLTPDGDPFFAGTYLPKQQLLALLANAGAASGPSSASGCWPREPRSRSSCGRTPVRRHRRGSMPGSATPRCGGCARPYDDVRGGFGGAPKFPPSMVLEFLLRHHARTGSADALAMVRGTCEAMARGGLYDQLGGGFARYAVDADWVVPHFEKMLYDNALLLRVYAHLWRSDGRPAGPPGRRGDRRLPAARPAHRRGRVRVGPRRRHRRRRALARGPHLRVDPGAAGRGPRARRRRAGRRPARGHRGGHLRVRAVDAAAAGRPRRPRVVGGDPRPAARRRGRRAPQPSRDDKVVTAWNGLAVAALADAGALLGRPDLVARRRGRRGLRARACTWSTGVLRRTSRAGRVGTAPAVLDDHGDLAEGLLALHQATGDPRWARGGGGRCSTRRSSGSSTRTARCTTPRTTPRRCSRGPRGAPTTPSRRARRRWPVRCSRTPPSPGRRATGTRPSAALDACGPVAQQDPRFAGWALAVAEAVVAGPLQVAVVGDGRGRRRPARGGPGQHVARSRGGATGPPDTPGVPLLAARPLVGGPAAAYVCRGSSANARRHGRRRPASHARRGGRRRTGVSAPVSTRPGMPGSTEGDDREPKPVRAAASRHPLSPSARRTAPQG